MSQDTTTTENQPQPTTASDSSAQIEALQAEVARLQGIASGAQDEAKKYRQQKAEQTKAAEAAARENGEFKQLAEQLLAERDALRTELEQAAPVVAAFKQDQEARAKALEGRIAALNDSDKALILGAGNLATQEALAARLLQEAPRVTIKQDAEGQGENLPKQGNDFADMSADDLRKRFGSGASGTVRTSLGTLFKP